MSQATISEGKLPSKWGKVKRVARKAPRAVARRVFSVAHYTCFILVGGFGVIMMRGHALGQFDAAPNLAWWAAVGLLFVAASGLYDRGFDRGKVEGSEDMLDKAYGTVKKLAERKLDITIVHNVTSDEELGIKTGVHATEH